MNGVVGAGPAGPPTRSGGATPARTGSPAEPALGARFGLGVLERGFFDRPVLAVAAALLGCVLAHETSAGVVAVALSEVEAYAGAGDPASHAFRGKTARNAVMFGEPGHAYVYFTYGMHFCVNLVCGPVGEASAVLLRAGRVIEGAGLAAERRGAAGPAAGGAAGRAVGRKETDLARGPARLCQALGIGRELNGTDVCAPASPLRVLAPADRAGGVVGDIDCGPRVGVSRAAEVAWRFWKSGDPTVSVYRPHVPRRPASGPGVSGPGGGGPGGGDLRAPSAGSDGLPSSPGSRAAQD